MSSINEQFRPTLKQVDILLADLDSPVSNLDALKKYIDRLTDSPFDGLADFYRHTASYSKDTKDVASLKSALDSLGVMCAAIKGLKQKIDAINARDPSTAGLQKLRMLHSARTLMLNSYLAELNRVATVKRDELRAAAATTPSRVVSPASPPRSTPSSAARPSPLPTPPPRPTSPASPPAPPSRLVSPGEPRPPSRPPVVPPPPGSTPPPLGAPRPRGPESPSDEFSRRIHEWDLLVMTFPVSRKDMKRRGITPKRLEEMISDFNAAYSSLLMDNMLVKGASPERNNLIDNVNNKRQNFLEIFKNISVDQNPFSMSFSEVVAELTEQATHTEAQRAQALLNAFEKMVNNEPEGPEKSRLIVLAASIAAAVKGSSGANDFSANLNEVWGPFSGANATPQGVLVGLFFKPRADGTYPTEKQVIDGTAEINMDVPKLWRYIVRRIKHTEQNGGLSRAVTEERMRDGRIIYRDNTGGLLQQKPRESTVAYQERLRLIMESDSTFSYKSLSEQITRGFQPHLDLVFADMDPEVRSTAILFFKTFGARSAGYIPHLIRGQTRSHGISVSATRKDDEAAYVAPLALRMYQATRYDKVKFHRYMARFLSVPKELYLKLIKEHDPSKLHKAEELYSLMEDYTKIQFGIIPPWHERTRELFAGPNPKIDLNGSLFPLFPEALVNIMEVEQQKRDLQASFTPGFAGDIRPACTSLKKFVDTYFYQGYFRTDAEIDVRGVKTKKPILKVMAELESAVSARSSVTDIKIMANAILNACKGDLVVMANADELSDNFTVANYVLAADAAKQMFDKFDVPNKVMTRKEIKTVMDNWRSSVIGKAKLVPGRHQLLFAPLTAELLCTLLQVYDKRGIWEEVKRVYAEEMGSMTGKGVPSYVVDQLKQLLGTNTKEPPEYVQQKPRGPQKVRYRARLHFLGKSEAGGFVYPGLSDFEPPYEYDEVVEKDTTASASGKH